MSIWGLGPLAARAATNRFALESAPGAGGHLELGDLFWRDTTGRFVARGGGANGAGLIDVTYGAAGVSTTALRATLNNGNGGAYLSGYSAEASFAHNSEFIAGSGWVARHTDAARYTQSGGAHFWYGNTGLTAGAAFTPSLRMQLDASGRLMLGGAAANYQFNIGGSNPGRGIFADIANSAGSPNGAQISFTQNGITNNAFGMVPGSADMAIYFSRNAVADGTQAWRWQSDGHYRPGADNVYDLGTASFRGRTAYFGTGAINTSDATQKLWLGDGLAPAELRAAKRISASIGFYKWLQSIEEKGEENARIHFGVRAQIVWAIMAEEGLIAPLTDGEDPTCRYAFLCWDKWDELTEPVFEDVIIPAVLNEDGVEIEAARVVQVASSETRLVRAAGSAFGIREGQLLMFLTAAQEVRLAALEAAA